MRTLLLGLGLSVGLATSIGLLASQPEGTHGDGTVRSELTLRNRPVTVATAPRADGSGEPNLLSSGPTSARLKVGMLHSHPRLRIGELDGSDLWYDLWLTRTDTPSSWILEAQPAVSDASVPNNAATISADVAGTIPLLHETVDRESAL